MNPDDFMAFKLMNCSFLGLFRGLQNYDEKTYSVFPKQCLEQISEPESSLDQILVPECSLDQILVPNCCLDQILVPEHILDQILVF